MPASRAARRVHRGGDARSRAVRRAAFVLAAVAAVLAGCKSTPEAEAPPQLGARLRQVAFSTVDGLVSFAPYSGGIVIMAMVMNTPAGTSRLAIHENPICTSPNGFAAGPPLRIPGTSEPAMILVASGGDNSRSTQTVRLPGLTIDALRGRSVVIHAGPDGSLDAEPGVRNNRIACGVIEAMQPLF